MQHLNKVLVISGVVLAVLILIAGSFMIQPVDLVFSATPENPAIPAQLVGVTWGPSYYANDTIIEPERHRPELELMEQVDRQALGEQSWGPSYTGDTTIVAPGTRPINSVVTWGPSYYGNDTLVSPERHRPELNLMKQVDLNALKGVTEGPAYHE